MSLGNIDLNPQLIQAVRDATDVISVASEHTRLTKAGHRYKGLCPLHKEKTPSFSVDPERGLFYCFGCGAGGDAIRLHMLTSGDDFPAAIETLARRYGIPLPAAGSRRRGDERDPHRALRAAEEFFRDQLSRSAFARRYLAERQISAELAERFALGYAPEGWRNLVEALSGKIPLADLEAAGLVGRSDKGSGRPFDRFRQRLIFPIRNASGRLLGFGGRTLGDDRAKYINTQETEQFRKGLLLYGLYEGKRSLRDSGKAVLVEGYFDVLGTLASGVEGAVACMGTSLTQEQARLLSRFSEQVTLAYDGDEAGVAAARRALPILLGQGFAVRRAKLPAGQDPDSLRLEAGPEAVHRAVTQAPDAVAAELRRLVPEGVRFDPTRQGKAAEAVAAILRAIPDPIVRAGYSRVVSDRLEVSEQHLWQKVRPGAEGAGPAGPAPSGEASREALPWTLEGNILEGLLGGEGEVPGLSELPSPEIFPNRECRRVYQVFLDLYGHEGNAPSVEDVRMALDPGGPEIQLLARLFGTAVAAGRSFGVRELFARLDRWWLERYLEDLHRKIRESERAGDTKLNTELCLRRAEATRLRHKGQPGTGWAYRIAQSSDA